MKLNSFFFPAPYAIGKENAVLGTFLGRGGSPLGMGLAQPQGSATTSGPRFGAGEQGPGPSLARLGK